MVNYATKMFKDYSLLKLMDYFYINHSFTIDICDKLMQDINTSCKSFHHQYDMTIDNEINNILLSNLCFNIEKYKKNVHFPFEELSINHYTIHKFNKNNNYINNFGRLIYKKNVLTYIWALNDIQIKLFNNNIDLEKGTIIIFPCEWFYNILFLNKSEIYLIIGNVYVDI